MCNIAGYVGQRPAAPILIQMLKKQEGLAGGFYSGIATIHQGKIYYQKLTGDVDRLVQLTKAASLPGSIGIIHSRSNSGGGDEWAHPFVAGGNNPKIAYVANGSVGMFAHRTDEYSRRADELLAAGYEFLSRVQSDSDKYNRFSDGSALHMSDLMCQQIMYNKDHGADTRRAIADAFCQMPSEVVGLLLSLTEADRIFWARINFPMSVSFAPHGAYLSSASLALPEDHGKVEVLPPLSSGCVYRDHYTAQPFEAPPVAVASVDEQLGQAAYERISSALEKEEMTVSQIRKTIKELFDVGACAPMLQLCYEVLQRLTDEGRLSARTLTVPGAAPELTAPKLAFRIVK